MLRIRLAAYGFALSAANMVVVAATGLVLTPILLRYLGPERLGAYRAGLELLGYLTLLDLGMTYALTGLFASAVARNDREMVLGGVAASARVYSRIAVAWVLVTAAVAFAAPYLLVASDDTLADLRVGIVCTAVGMSVPWLIPLRTLVEARQLGYLVQLVGLGTTLVIFGAAVWLAVAGLGITGQFLASAAGTLFAIGVLAAVELRRHPEEWAAVRGRVPIPAEVKKQLWALNWSGFTVNLASRLTLYSGNLIVGVALGPAAVVPFFATQRLIQFASTPALAVGNAVWAGLADLHHRGERATLHARLTQLTRYMVILALAGIVPTAVWTRSFVRLWVGGDYYAGPWLVGLAGAAALAQTLASLWGWVFAATGTTPRIVGGWVVAGATSIVLGVALTPVVGLVGPLVGTLAGLSVLVAWCVPRRLRDEFGVPLRPLAGAVLGPVLAAGVALVPTAVVSELIPVEELAGSRAAGFALLTAVLALSAVGYLALCWVAVLSRAERAEWGGRVARVLGLRRKREGGS